MTIHTDFVLYYYVIYSILIVFVGKMLILRRDKATLRPSKIISENKNFIFQVTDLELWILKLSIQAFRALVVLISNVTILAVDFYIFPQKHVKTLTYGFSLMDIGVGYFILCHSMRVIRKVNVSPSNHYWKNNDQKSVCSIKE